MDLFDGAAALAQVFSAVDACLKSRVCQLLATQFVTLASLGSVFRNAGWVSELYHVRAMQGEGEPQTRTHFFH